MSLESRRAMKMERWKGGLRRWKKIFDKNGPLEMVACFAGKPMCDDNGVLERGPASLESGSSTKMGRWKGGLLRWKANAR